LIFSLIFPVLLSLITLYVISSLPSTPGVSNTSSTNLLLFRVVVVENGIVLISLTISSVVKGLVPLVILVFLVGLIISLCLNSLLIIELSLLL
jgi:hypothetical protein